VFPLSVLLARVVQYIKVKKFLNDSMLLLKNQGFKRYIRLWLLVRTTEILPPLIGKEEEATASQRTSI